MCIYAVCYNRRFGEENRILSPVSLPHCLGQIVLAMTNSSQEKSQHLNKKGHSISTWKPNHPRPKTRPITDETAINNKYYQQSLLHDLQWLAVQACIKFKITMLGYLFMALPQSHLPELMLLYHLTGQFQTGFLSIPHIRLKTFCHFSFSFIAPSISKGMPPSLCTAKLVHVFGSGLKTSLSETPPNSSILLSFVLYTISGFLHVLQLWTGAWSCIYVVFLCAQLWYLYHMASLLIAQGP